MEGHNIPRWRRERFPRRLGSMPSTAHASDHEESSLRETEIRLERELARQSSILSIVPARPRRASLAATDLASHGSRLLWPARGRHPRNLIGMIPLGSQPLWRAE